MSKETYMVVGAEFSGRHLLAAQIARNLRGPNPNTILNASRLKSYHKLQHLCGACENFEINDVFWQLYDHNDTRNEPWSSDKFSDTIWNNLLHSEPTIIEGSSVSYIQSIMRYVARSIPSQRTSNNIVAISLPPDNVLKQRIRRRVDRFHPEIVSEALTVLQQNNLPLSLHDCPLFSIIERNHDVTLRNQLLRNGYREIAYLQQDRLKINFHDIQWVPAVPMKWD